MFFNELVLNLQACRATHPDGCDILAVGQADRPSIALFFLHAFQELSDNGGILSSGLTI